MADRVESFVVTFPAGTPQANPLTVATPFNDGVVTAIRVRVPNGPMGTMGFTVGYSGQSIVPDTAGTWLVMNDEKWELPLSNNPTGAGWQLRGYNTDVFNHSVYIQYLIDELRVPTPSGSVIEPIPLGG